MNHYVSACCAGERCRMCGTPATHKVEEEVFWDDPNLARHPLSAYLCCQCFASVVGHTAPCTEHTPALRRPGARQDWHRIHFQEGETILFHPPSFGCYVETDPVCASVLATRKNSFGRVSYQIHLETPVQRRWTVTGKGRGCGKGQGAPKGVQEEQVTELEAMLEDLSPVGGWPA